MSKTSRLTTQLVAALGAMVIVAAYLQLWKKAYHSDPNGDILVIVNRAEEDAKSNDNSLSTEMTCEDALRKFESTNDDVLSTQVLKGASKEKGLNCTALNLGVRSDPDQGQLDEIAHNVARALARKPTLGVIAASTSLLSGPVINVCTHLGIPLLLVTATNDNLLDDNTKGIVFRLPAKNSAQVQSIIDGLKDGRTHDNIALVYETNSYGKSLHDGLARGLNNGETFYSFSISQYTDIAVVVSLLESFRVDTCIFLGYSDMAGDLLRKLTGVAKKLTSDGRQFSLLLSDGCYSPANVCAKGLQVKLYFPVSNPKDSGLGVFGGDAVKMLHALKRKLSATSFLDPQPSLNEVFNATENLANKDLHVKDVQKQRKDSYNFNDKGESTSTSYQSTSISSCETVVKKK